MISHPVQGNHMMSPFQDTRDCLILNAKSIQSHPPIHLPMPKLCGLLIHAQLILSPTWYQITHHHPKKFKLPTDLDNKASDKSFIGQKATKNLPHLLTFVIIPTRKPNSSIIGIILRLMNNYLSNKCSAILFVTVGLNLFSLMRKIINNPCKMLINIDLDSFRINQIFKIHLPLQMNQIFLTWMVNKPNLSIILPKGYDCQKQHASYKNSK